MPPSPTTTDNTTSVPPGLQIKRKIEIPQGQTILRVRSRFPTECNDLTHLLLLSSFMTLPLSLGKAREAGTRPLPAPVDQRIVPMPVGSGTTT